MRPVLEHGHIFWIPGINLTAFENLQRNRPVAIVSQERTAARLSHIFHHATNAHRTVQFFTQINHKLRIFQFFHILTTAEERLLNEPDDFLYIRMAIVPTVQLTQISKSFLLQFYQNTGQHLLVSNRIPFQTIRHHIIYILHENDIGLQIIQILDKRPMSAWTEQKCAVHTERFIVHRGS